MLVRNYGLFWKRNDIFWGRFSVAGHLKGVWTGARSDESQHDFREQQGIYVLYDDNFQMVYVGRAGRGEQRLFKRLGQHRKDQLADRWTRFSWFGVRPIDEDGCLGEEIQDMETTVPDVLNHVEAVLIAAAEPPNNRQGGGFGGDVQQYLQYRDEENIGLELYDLVSDIATRLEEVEDKIDHME